MSLYFFHAILVDIRRVNQEEHGTKVDTVQSTQSVDLVDIHRVNHEEHGTKVDTVQSTQSDRTVKKSV